MTDRPLTPTEYDSLRRAAMQRAAALREQALSEAWAAIGRGLRAAARAAWLAVPAPASQRASP
jgi:hypothetical protein